MFGELLDKTIVWGFGPDACEEVEIEADAGLAVVAVIGAVGVGLDMDNGSGEGGAELGLGCAGCRAGAAPGCPIRRNLLCLMRRRTGRR